jgi:hypothetical protein
MFSCPNEQNSLMLRDLEMNWFSKFQTATEVKRQEYTTKIAASNDETFPCNGFVLNT